MKLNDELLDAEAKQYFSLRAVKRKATVDDPNLPVSFFPYHHFNN